MDKDGTFERIDGVTPSGGDYSIAYFYDKDGTLCLKGSAIRISIVEYTENGDRINETFVINE